LKKLAFATALAALLLNLGLEYWLMAMPSTAVIVPGFADFRPAWNHGVSFSLFTQDSEQGRYILMAVLAAISAWVGFMAWRAVDRLSALAYGLILGGALGNLFDRAAYGGAVFDFLYLHLGSMPLFICNFADIAISLGVFLLVLEWAHPKPRSTSNPSQP
jgi:signal peptidase II